MPRLYFRVESDWEKVVKLREEISKLESQIKTMDANKAPHAVAVLNKQVIQSQKQLKGMVSDAAKAAVIMDGDFKTKIYSGSQAVNEYTKRVISAKDRLRELQTEYRRLSGRHTELGKNTYQGIAIKKQMDGVSNSMAMAKDKLFALSQEQSKARLSVKQLKDEYALYDTQVKDTTSSTFSLGKAFGVIGGVAVLKRLGSEIINVRGQFRAMEISLETMVGENKAKALLADIKQYAAISPLGLKEVQASTEMMIGFNVEAEKVPRFIQAIGDISRGENQKFQSLSLAFSQMSAAGKLMGQDLNQMINAGFNPLQIISEKTGKSMAQLRDEMSKGAISAETVQQAFIDATSAGGKFYGMSEKQSQEVAGQMAILSDTISNKLNEIGESNEGIIKSGIGVATSMVNNYETIGRVTAGLIATYGTYRTALMLNAALELGSTKAVWSKVTATKAATVAQDTYNKVLKMNPYVAVGAAVVALGIAMWTLADHTTAAEKAQKEYNETKETSVQKDKEHKEKLEELISAIQSEYTSSLDRVKAMDEIKKAYPALFQKYIDEKGHIKDLIGLWKEYNEEASRGKVKENNDSYQKAKSNYEQKLKDYNNNTYLANTNTYVTPAQAQLSAKKELDKAEQLMRQWQKDVRSDELAQWQLDLKKNTDLQIKTELNEMKRLQQARKVNPRYSLSVGVGSLKGSVTESELRQRAATLESELSSRNPKAETKNKSYWEKKKKEAEAVLESIASDQKRLMDAGNFKGIDAKIAESYKTNSKLLKEAEKELKPYDSYSKQENQAEKVRKQTDKYNVLLSKQALEEKRTTEDLQAQVDEARVKAMDEGSQKTIAEMELNFKKERQAIDRQKEDLLRKRISDARDEFESNPKNKGKTFDGSEISLSDDDTKYFDELYKSTISNNEKAYSSLVNQYLAYSDERIAIEKKFNDDVAIMQEARKKAEGAGDTDGVAKIDRSISKRNEKFNEDTQALDLEQLKKDLNWEQVFGNLDKVSTNSLTNLKVKLKDFVGQIKNLSPENMKELMDAIEGIDNKISERNPFESMSVSFKELRNATELAKAAQDAYNKAVENGTQKEIDNAKATLDNARDKKQKALAESTIALRNGVNEAGQYVDSANQILGIMEAIGIETPEWLNKYMSGVGEMLNGLSSIDLTKPMSIVTGSLQTLKGALTSVVSLGGLIPGLGGADYSRYNEMKDQYDTLNTIWDQLIDKKKEYIGISYGSEANKVGKEALELAQKSIDSYRTLGLELLNSGASAGSRSIGKRIRKGMSREGWDQWDSFANSIGMNPDDVGGRMEGLFSLSIEQLEKLKSEAPTFWAKLNDETREYLNSIIEGGERLEEIQEQIKEQLTQVSFDNVFDSFVDTLMDMDSSSKDFANNFEEYMQRAVLTTMVGNKFNSRLQTWYDNFAKANEDKAGITKDEMDKSQAEWDAIVADAVAERDQLKNLFGWDSASSSQSASSKGYQTISQDTGEELKGRFTALQAAGEEIKRLNMEQTMSLKEFAARAGEILTVNSDIRNIADDTRNILASTYLETVEIKENTGAIIKPIKSMAADIAEVKQNTKGLSSR
ncbi:MAG: tape measure protein [Bacteroides xylanisolvens]